MHQKLKRRVKGRPCPWITNEIAECMNKSVQLPGKVEKSRRQEHCKIYKKKRNGCTKIIRNTKGDSHKQFFQENSRNPCNIWKYIKEIIPKQIKEQILELCTIYQVSYQKYFEVKSSSFLSVFL